MSFPSAPKLFCPVCQRRYDESRSGFCPVDGARLRPGSELGARWVGQLVGDKYRVRRFLGSGATAEVYEAEHVEIGRRVAIKVLLPLMSSEPTMVERFRQEARLVALIAHPNVVGVEDIGTLPDGSLYMVMELLRGRSLEQAIGDDVLDPAFALDVLVQVCEGLAAAHERNVVHRDIKPGNIFLCEADDAARASAVSVKILDLGIGKLQGQDTVSNLTVTGTIFGTPEYMSPEQAMGLPVDARSDLYALGVVAYELLLDQRPFVAGSFLGVLTKHMTETPRWPHNIAAERGLPLSAEGVVLKALAKNADHRYQSAHELREALAGLRAELGRVEQPSSTQATRPADAARVVATAPRTTTVRRVALGDASGSDREVVEIAPDVFWVGRRRGGLLECNSYLRLFRGPSQQLALLVDPGPPSDLDVMAAKVSSVLGSLSNVDLVFLNHQDPDVAANAPLIQQLNPRAHVLCSEDTWRLVRFYGLRPQGYSAVEHFRDGQMRLATGHYLSFVPTPFCHFRGAVMLYDQSARVLFSGDLFGGLSHDPTLTATEAHWPDVEIFHELYMPSRSALRLAMDRIRQLVPAPLMIAPQHGAIIGPDRIDLAVGRLGALEVGMDLLDHQGDKQQVLGALGEMVHELAARLGPGPLGAQLRRFSSDGSFPNLFAFADELTIVDIKIEPRAAARALVRDLVASTDEAVRPAIAALCSQICARHGVSLRAAPEESAGG